MYNTLFSLLPLALVATCCANGGDLSDTHNRSTRPRGVSAPLIRVSVDSSTSESEGYQSSSSSDEGQPSLVSTHQSALKQSAPILTEGNTHIERSGFVAVKLPSIPPRVVTTEQSEKTRGRLGCCLISTIVVVSGGAIVTGAALEACHLAGLV